MKKERRKEKYKERKKERKKEGKKERRKERRKERKKEGRKERKKAQMMNQFNGRKIMMEINLFLFLSKKVRKTFNIQSWYFFPLHARLQWLRG